MKLFKKNSGELTAVAKRAFNSAPTPKGNEHIYLVTSSKRGVNYTDKVYFTELLELLNISYEAGNDAPRGGAAGDYIRLSKQGAIAYNKIKAKLL